jgi:hypothetical protein
MSYDMVAWCSSEPLLGGAADLALRARDVVERLVEGVDPERLEGRDDPLVEVGVAVGEAHALHELSGGVERVRDDRLRVHEHGAAAADAPDDLEPVLLGRVEVDLVAERLEAADDDRGLVPLPEAQGGAAAAGADLLGEDLVEGEVQVRRDGAVVDDLPLVVAPVAGLRQAAADRDRDRLGREAEQHGPLGQALPDGGGDGRGVRLDGQAVHRAVDRVERRVRLEEEVAGETELGDAALAHLQVDHHELAARDLVLTVHASSLCLRRAVRWGGVRRVRSASRTEREDASDPCEASREHWARAPLTGPDTLKLRAGRGRSRTGRAPWSADLPGPRAPPRVPVAAGRPGKREWSARGLPRTRGSRPQPAGIPLKL